MQTLPLITSKFTPILCGCGGHQWHWFGSFLVPCREAGPSSRRKLFTFFCFFLLKHAQYPNFGIPRAFQPPKQNIYYYVALS